MKKKKKKKKKNNRKQSLIFRTSTSLASPVCLTFSFLSFFFFFFVLSAGTLVVDLPPTWVLITVPSTWIVRGWRWLFIKVLCEHLWLTSAMFLDSTEGRNEEDQIGRAVPAQRLPVGVKRRWMRQSVRGVEARKVSDNEQMSWYFAQEESVEFNLQHTRYVREDLSTTRRRVFKLGVKTSRWWESWSILAKQLSSCSSQSSDEMLSNPWRREADRWKGVQIERTERLRGSCRHSWGRFCWIF